MRPPSYYIKKYEEFDKEHGFFVKLTDYTAEVLVGEALYYSDCIANADYFLRENNSDAVHDLEAYKQACKIINEYKIFLLEKASEISLLEFVIQNMNVFKAETKKAIKNGEIELANLNY